MASFKEYTASGGASEAFSIQTFSSDEIKVYVDNVLKTATTHYNITNYNTNGGTVTWTDGNVPSSGTVRIVRDTNVLTPRATYSAGSSVKSDDLNNNQTQALRSLEEQDDQLIQTYDVQDSAITTAKIKADNITSALIADDQINSEHYAADSIDTEHYAPGSVDDTALATNSVTTIKINADAVTAAKLADNAVVEANIVDNNVTNAKIGTNAVQTANILADSVTYEKIQNVTASGVVLGRNSSGAGIVEEVTAAELRTILNIENGSTGDMSNAEIRAAVEAATDSNVFTDDDHTRLNGIAAGAEVNVQSDWNASSGDAQILNKPTIPTVDASSVNSAGAVMESDVDAKGDIFAGTADNTVTRLPASTTNGHILTIDTTEATGMKWAANAGSGGGGSGSAITVVNDSTTLTADATKLTFTGAGVTATEPSADEITITIPGGSGISNIVEDTSPQLGGALDVQAQEINTSTTNGNIKLTPDGTGVVEVKGNTNPGTIQLNCENNSHGVKIKGPAHSAAASYTLTLPDTDGSANEILKTDGSGNLSWVADANTTYSVGDGGLTQNNFTNTLKTKLDGIDDSADVTDATTVNTAGAVMKTIVDAKGDIIVGTADNTYNRLAVGDTNGKVLSVDSSTSTGLAWAAASSGTITALNNQAANRLTTIGSTTTQLDGEANLTFDGSTLAVTGNQTVSTTLAATGQITGRGFECPAEVTDDWTIAAANNAMFPGPMTIASSKTVTVPASRTLTIV